MSLVGLALPFGYAQHGDNARMERRILLIEDDARLAGMVCEYLGEAGFRVVHAANGRSGLALHASAPFDAMVRDLMLPDMDGLEVCRALRTKFTTPVLMLTARAACRPRAHA